MKTFCTHKRTAVLGYNTEGKQGCGIRWTHMRSDYTHMKDRCCEMRPDLEWIGGYN